MLELQDFEESIVLRVPPENSCFAVQLRLNYLHYIKF